MFDTVNHDILKAKLDHYGIRGVPLNWFYNYLTHRQQFVCYNDTMSDVMNVNCGVPQGSVLGPKSYVLYTAPLGHVIRRHELQHHFYADDSQLYQAFKTRDNLIQNEALDRIECGLIDIDVWIHQNKLKLNTDKT